MAVIATVALAAAGLVTSTFVVVASSSVATEESAQKCERVSSGYSRTVADGRCLPKVEVPARR